MGKGGYVRVGEERSKERVVSWFNIVYRGAPSMRMEAQKRVDGDSGNNFFPRKSRDEGEGKREKGNGHARRGVVSFL